ncbi:hypothetical protein WN944_014327 [Citrus x changshan-huyou]|uniref:Uncharacterized protein n=1 Tax=Citrus x changshan-huyou TaxID=2935761 RepID=A0AAP0M6P5_9ROSI
MEVSLAQKLCGGTIVEVSNVEKAKNWRHYNSYAYPFIPSFNLSIFQKIQRFMNMEGAKSGDLVPFPSFFAMRIVRNNLLELEWRGVALDFNLLTLRTQVFSALPIQLLHLHHLFQQRLFDQVRINLVATSLFTNNNI